MKRSHFKFRLYIAGGTENSGQALANLTALCTAHLANAHEIEIVDVLREPTRALADSVFMTPALIKLVPSPVQKLFGTLSQTDSVMAMLGLKAAAA